MKKLYSFMLLAVTAAWFASCSTDIVYSRFAPMESKEWNADSAVRFDFLITDAAASYRMLVYVRHNERYPYQNMWLFINDGVRRDTIEFYLADDRGKWLGDQHHGFIEMPVLYEQEKQFPDTGQYTLSIEHGMRDSLLRGIMDIGLEIRRNGEK